MGWGGHFCARSAALFSSLPYSISLRSFAEPVPSHALPSASAMTVTPMGGRLSGRSGNLEEQLTASGQSLLPSRISLLTIMLTCWMSAHHLQTARAAQRRAAKATADAFAQYTAALEAERGAAREVQLHEDRRDNLGTCRICSAANGYLLIGGMVSCRRYTRSV